MKSLTISIRDMFKIFVLRDLFGSIGQSRGDLLTKIYNLLVTPNVHNIYLNIQSIFTLKKNVLHDYFFLKYGMSSTTF